MSTILEICQDAASLVATQKPTDLFDVDNQQSAIFLSIAKDTLESLRRFGDWQELTKEGRLTVSPHQSIYYIPDFCPDFYALINNTIYIRDTSEKLIGAITPEQWMTDRFFNGGDAGLRFKIQNNCLRFLTPPQKTCQIIFFYRSAVVALETEHNGCTYEEKTTITKNTDVPVFDEYLVKLGIVWRWYKRNGMPYEEEMNEYEKEVKAKFGNGLSGRDICLCSGWHPLHKLGGIHVVSHT
ncbi:MAG: hypothetical protein IJY58_04070 [Alphaproteobacteria bacterium]|nr:hypothetical protein [Alphaproteobacteria bacterium]